MLFEENTVCLTHYDTLSFSVFIVCLFLSFVKVDLTTVYLFLVGTLLAYIKVIRNIRVSHLSGSLMILFDESLL